MSVWLASHKSERPPMVDLEFLTERVSRLPTRKEQALKPPCMIVGSAAIVTAWIELFWRHCL
jgi:hypothetical protein